MDELVKFAYSMRKKVYNEGSVILSQADRFDSVGVVKKGIIKITHKMTKRTNSKVIPKENQRSSMISIPNPVRSIDVAVDIAEISIHDLIGVVEAMTNAKKMRNEVVAQTHAEVFFIPSKIFTSFLKPEKKTATYIEKLGK